MASLLINVEDQVKVIRQLVPKLLLLTLSAVISLPLIPVVWIGSKLYHRPPTMLYASQVLRYLYYAWTATPSSPGITLCGRLYATLSIFQHALLAPIIGAAWLLDEVLYGRSLGDIQVIRPFFLVSGGRSGSTQITRYLEDDPDLVAPSILMCLFPYIWLWKLVPLTIGRFVTPDRIREAIADNFPPETLERHELDPFRADTFEVTFLSTHLLGIALQLGPETSITEFNFAEYAPHNKHLFEELFPLFVDRLGRKSLLFHQHQKRQNTSDNPTLSPRFFIKGHFLLAAPALARRYPDASFLTITREPLSRLQSIIHFVRSAPVDPLLGPLPWEWIVQTMSETECRYCEIEQEWFTATKGKKITQCVIRFQDFVDDLPGTMAKVYEDCLGYDSAPEHLPKVHHPRDRQNYSVNRSLDDLGVDHEAMKKRLSEYIAWISQ